MASFNIRCGVLDINIEYERLNNIPREQRLCSFCNTNNIDEEINFLVLVSFYFCVYT